MAFAEDKVPNAPCGVERLVDGEINEFSLVVPNAPCGVERLGFTTQQESIFQVGS